MSRASSSAITDPALAVNVGNNGRYRSVAIVRRMAGRPNAKRPPQISLTFKWWSFCDRCASS